MSPVDSSVIERKLRLMEERLEALAPIAKLSLEEYRSDLIRRKGAEKLTQELINAAIDTNFHVLVQSGQKAPERAHDSFVALATIGVLDLALAKTLAQFAGLRNRLVHEYEAIDDVKVLAALEEAGRVFPPYILALRKKFCPPPNSPK